ncbi:MAG: hypothetical protein R3E99_09045 [Burkholderiaceae bacterium]
MQQHSQYIFCSKSVSTTLSLPVLAAGTDDAHDRIQIDRVHQTCPDQLDWSHHWRDGAEVVLSLARHGADYWLRFPGLADFLLQPHSLRVVVAGDTSTDPNTLEHLLVDQVLPRLLAHLGSLMVHASAVQIGEHHALFIGPSGRGKSTLAALLKRRGHSVLSDDCVQLRTGAQGCEALPTYPSLRLYADSLENVFPGEKATSPVARYSEKLRLALEAPAMGMKAFAVDAMYLLEDPLHSDIDVHIWPSPPSRTCQALLGHSFRLDLADRDGNAAHFARCASVVNKVPTFGLVYPRDFSQSAKLVDTIAQHLSTVTTDASQPRKACTATTTIPSTHMGP